MHDMLPMHDSIAAALLPFFQTWVGVVSVRAPFQDCMHALTLMIKSQGHPTCLHGVIQVF